MHECSDAFESLGSYVVQSSVFGSTAMYWRVLWLVRLYAGGSGFVGLYWLAPPSYSNFSEIFSGFSVCPTVLVYAYATLGTFNPIRFWYSQFYASSHRDSQACRPTRTMIMLPIRHVCCRGWRQCKLARDRQGAFSRYALS